MFLLCVAALFIIPFFFRRDAAHASDDEASAFAMLQMSAVVGPSYSELVILSPGDLPETGHVDFFVLTYAIGTRQFKLVRDSVTVPRFAREAPRPMRLVRAVSLDQSGGATDVTHLLEVFAGDAGRFLGNDRSLPQILEYTGYRDECLAVVTYIEPLSMTWTDCLFHTSIVLCHARDKRVIEL